MRSFGEDMMSFISKALVGLGSLLRNCCMIGIACTGLQCISIKTSLENCCLQGNNLGFFVSMSTSALAYLP